MPKKRGRKPLLDPELVAAALAELSGNVAAVGKRFGGDRAAVAHLIAKRPALQRVTSDAREGMLDNAESSLYRAVLAGEAWAVCFFLKTQGRGRGYVERPQDLPRSRCSSVPSPTTSRKWSDRRWRTRYSVAEIEAAVTDRAGERLDRYRTDPALLMADVGLPPDAWQQRLLRSDATRVLMLTCRQAGKSTTAGFLALREALFTAGTTVLVMCPSQRQSAELVRRVRDAVNRLGGLVAVDGESVLQVRFANGSRVIALPASESGIRCFTAGMVILDEAARIPDALVAAVRPTLGTTGGKLVCLSTAFARSGWFYDAWASPEPWERVRVTADQNPRLSAAFLAEERRTLGSRWYAMEYECQFQDDVAALFSLDDINRAVTDAVKPLFGPPAGAEIAGASAGAVKPLFDGG